MSATVPPEPPPLPIELLLDILELCHSTSPSLLDSQRLTLRFGLVCRGWYHASIAGTNTFVTNGLKQTLALSHRLTDWERPIKRLSVTLPSPAGGRPDFRSRETLSSPKALQTLLSRCGALLTLEIATGLWLALTSLKKSRHSLRSLKSLTLSDNEADLGVLWKEVSCEQFVETLLIFPSLEELKMNSKGVVVWDSQELHLSRLRFSHLRNLSCDNDDPSLFYSLITAARHSLRSLDIGFRAIDDDNLVIFELVSPSLQHFTSRYAAGDWWTPHLPNLEELVRTMVNIQTLDFSGSLIPASYGAISSFISILKIVKEYDGMRRIDFGLIELSDLRRLLGSGLRGRKRGVTALVIRLKVPVSKCYDKNKVGKQLEKLRRGCSGIDVRLEISLAVSTW